MSKEAMKLALETLYFLPALSPEQDELQDAAIEAIKEALAQPEQEPVAFEEWLANQHGDPEEVGFLQALRIAYISGQDSITTLREALAEQPAQPMHPEIKKMYEDYFDKCFRESSPAQQEPLKPCWYESKEKTMCRKCGQIHSEAISPAAQRTWVSLTDEQVIKTFNAICNGKPFNVERILELHRALEGELRSKNA